MFDTLRHDLKYARRSLRRMPGFTTAAILTLALGIGAATAIFSVANAALFKPLPYPAADRLFALMRPGGGAQTGQLFLFLRERTRLFESVAAQAPGIGWNFQTGGQVAFVAGLAVSEGFFVTHGVQPLLGREFSRDEDRSGGPNAAVISEALWRRVWDGAPQAVGASIQLGGVRYTVVGIMPASFRSVPEADVWTPLRISPRDNTASYRVIGRLRQGASVADADAELQSLRAEAIRELQPPTRTDVPEIRWLPYRRFVGAAVRDDMLLLLGAVAVLLLIACVNVASLQMTRAIARQREIATRTALGAGRIRSPSRSSSRRS